LAIRDQQLDALSRLMTVFAELSMVDGFQQD
jgi:hypothetical protein